MKLNQPVGNTPLIPISSRLIAGPGQVFAKDESKNPSGSVKARIAKAMIMDAIEAGKIDPETTIVESTSGNTGVGLALVAAALNLKLILTMPESMSIERRRLLTHLGAHLELTPAADGMNGAIKRAQDIAKAEAKSFMPDQFSNPSNPKIHRATTGPEIWQALDGQVDALVSGVGTGGTLSGTGGYLKELRPSCQIVAVEPTESPVISGGKPGPHKIQGIGAGFIPKTLNVALIDETIQISSDEAIAMAKAAATTEGLLVGISAGAALAAAKQLAEREAFAGKHIVCILPDLAERYQSTPLFA